MKASFRILAVLAALLLPALLVGLGERPVYKIQEVRVAETAREMVESGDYLVPRYNGELRLQKPPLPYWATAASFTLAGVNEFAARLPAVVFGLLSALVLGLWVRRETGLASAANSVLVLVTSFIGLRYFRSGEADAMLLFFIVGSSFLAYDFLYAGPSLRRRLLFGLALGLGFLSKGPAALAMPLLTLAAMALLERRAGRWQGLLRDVFSPAALLLLALTAFGWYAWILWRMPDFAPLIFGRQLDETFGSGTHAKPIWWYLAHLFEFFAPWGGLLVPAGWRAYRQRGAALAPLQRFAWVWLAVVFCLLTLTVNKQAQYALLFAPPIAIIVGDYLESARGAYARINRVLFALFVLGAIAAAVYAFRKSGGAADLSWLVLPLVPLLLQRALRAADLSLPVLVVAAVSATAFLYGESVLSKEPHKLAAQTLVEAVAADAPLYQLKSSVNDGALSFYAGRVVAPVTAGQIANLLQANTEIWLISDSLPELAGVSSQQVAAGEALKLYRLRAAD